MAARPESVDGLAGWSWHGFLRGGKPGQFLRSTWKPFLHPDLRW
jgi:hypothetical protein